MNPDDAHLEKLLDAYFEGSMDAQSRQDLDQLLTSSKAARDQFWERSEIDGALECWAEKSRGEALVFPVTPVRASSGWRKQRFAIAGWSAAALLTVAWLLHSQKPAATPPVVTTDPPSTQQPSPEMHKYRPVAYLSRVSGVSGNSALTQGQSISSGQEVVIREGILEMDFFSGARVSLQGPARFMPESDMRLTVREGLVQVDVPDSAKGFELALPDGTITDFGTSFEVAVSNDKTSRLQVSKGEIELAGTSGGGAAKRMFKGDAVSLATGKGSSPIDFKKLEVKDDLEFRTTEENRRREEKWNNSCAALAQDPSMLVHFRFLAEEKGSREIINRAKAPNAPGTGTVIAADWVTGRWEGKEALAFHGYADRVRVDVPGEYPQVTYLAWVMADNLPLRYNGLFLSEANIPGEAHWQFSREGAFTFGIRQDTELWQFHRAFSKPVLPPSSYGSWHFLGTTYDSATREVVHYVDGQEIHRSSIEASVPVRFGRATLGNFFDPDPAKNADVYGLGQSWSFRNWSGAIDEFMLFSRALDAAEIQQIYASGVPDGSSKH